MENAQLYSSANAMQKRDAADIIAEFSSRLDWRAEELVLDVGSGSGDVTHDLVLPTTVKNAKAAGKTSGGGNKNNRNSNSNVSVVGVDVSDQMVDHSWKKFGGAPRTLSFAQLDIAKEIPSTK